MVLGYPLPISRWTVIFWVKPIGIYTRPAAEKEFFVDFHELVFPELIFIEDIAGEDLG